MKNKKVLLLLSISMLIVFFITGCSAIDALSALKAKFKGESPPEISVEAPSDKEDSANDFEKDLGEPEVVKPPEQETIAVELWFADPNGEKLVKEIREIPKVEGIARATIGELIKGPSPESNLLPTIPVGTELKDINVKENGLIIVDFSKELIENHIGTPQAESLTVYSIVNTLCQFPTVDKVQFLVDGKYVESIAGSIDVSTALTPTTEL